MLKFLKEYLIPNFANLYNKITLIVYKIAGIAFLTLALNDVQFCNHTLHLHLLYLNLNIYTVL